jgi:hypothetical protein
MMGNTMHERQRCSRATLGFTVRSGWAAAVLLTGTPSSPRVLDSRRIDLSDPAMPESRQPYHHGFGTARAGGRELARLLRSVRQFGMQSVGALIREHQASGLELTGVGLVVGSLIDPKQIANDHIRIHALEGQLFRRVVQAAVEASGLSCSIRRDRDLYAMAAESLRLAEQEVRSTAAALGRATSGPWRVEEKLAGVAAWLLF